MDSKVNYQLKLWIAAGVAMVAVTLYIAGICIPLIQYNQESYSFVRDEFYQALCCRDYQNAPLGMLTFYIGHLWSDLWGESIFNLRVLSAIMVLLPVMITSWWFYRRTRRGVLSLVVLSLTVAGSALFTDRDYDWNTASFLFPTLLALAMLSWMDRRPVMGWVTGCLLALSVATRVTNLALLPCVVLIMAVCRGRLSEGLWRGLLKLVVSMVVTYLGVVLLVYGSVDAYLAAFNSDNIISGHTGAGIYIRSFFYLIGLVVLSAFPSLLICLLSPYMVRLRISGRSRWMLTGVVIVVVSGAWMKLYAAYSMLASHFLNMGGVYYGAWFAWLLAVPVWNRIASPERHITPDKLTMLIVWLFPMVFCVGSDVYLLRLYVMSFIPLLMAQLAGVMPRFTRMSMVMLTMCTLLLTVYVRFMPFLEHRPLLDLSCYVKVGKIYSPGDDRLGPLLKLVDERRQMVGDGKRVLMWGMERYFVDYAESDRPIGALNFFHNEEKYKDEEMRRLDSMIDSCDVVMMCNEGESAPGRYLIDYFEGKGFVTDSLQEHIIKFNRPVP